MGKHKKAWASKWEQENPPPANEKSKNPSHPIHSQPGVPSTSYGRLPHPSPPTPSPDPETSSLPNELSMHLVENQIYRQHSFDAHQSGGIFGASRHVFPLRPEPRRPYDMRSDALRRLCTKADLQVEACPPTPSPDAVEPLPSHQSNFGNTLRNCETRLDRMHLEPQPQPSLPIRYILPSHPHIQVTKLTTAELQMHLNTLPHVQHSVKEESSSSTAHPIAPFTTQPLNLDVILLMQSQQYKQEQVQQPRVSHMQQHQHQPILGTTDDHQIEQPMSSDGGDVNLAKAEVAAPTNAMSRRKK